MKELNKITNNYNQQMENNTQETSIALLQQASVIQTATLVRIEGKVNRIEEVLQHYVTIEHLEKNYVRRETNDNLKERVGVVIWVLGVVFVTTITALVNSIFKLIGR